MKEIALTQGQFALVDDCEYERLSQFKWYAMKGRNTFYAARHLPKINGKGPLILMHHAILGKPPKGLITDHRNGHGLDNRRKNLRYVTHRQNLQNLKYVNKSSKYPGVRWVKEDKKWRASIKINGPQKHLGYFTDEYEAFLAYEQAVNGLGESIIEGAKI